jgi:predicted transposase YbfD/YdcC
MESTASMNSRSTHQIDSKNRVMADAWNCQKRYVTTDRQISGENRVTVDLEIVNEY